ncbi:MAG: hypothetical protein ACE5I9_04160 [Candidatus Methylomirabilales bacterium]
MASTSERTFDELLARIERREQTARRRAIFYSLVPIAMAVIILGYTAYRIQSATTKVRELEKQATSYREQVTQLKAQTADLERKLEDAEARLKDATELGRYIHPIDFVDLKVLASRYPRETRVLQLILQLRQRGVRWRLGGQSPTEGFDSPSFAAFILRELNLPGGDVRPGESLLATSRRLWERLPPASRPRVGDLAFYPAGYALFYFVDQRQQPFVIGMTPFGITALKPNFAKVVGYRRARR